MAEAASKARGGPLPLLDQAAKRDYSQQLVELWPAVLAWVNDYYDAPHLRQAATWLLRLDPNAPEPLIVAALTHDMERHYPGGTQPDKAAGAWDDVEYNTRHARRSAEIVSDWLRAQGMSDAFVTAVIPPILEHEFGGSDQGNLIQTADSLSFLEVNHVLVARWVLNGETTLELGIRKLDWMYERIGLDVGRELARPLHEHAVASVRREVEQAGRG